MTRPETRGFLEKHVLDALVARGWAIAGSERDAIDLDVSIERSGLNGEVRFRNDFSPGREGAQSSAPSFVRVDIGRREGESLRWSVWEEDVTVEIGENERTFDFAYQAAIGRSWSSVSVSVRGIRPAKAWAKATLIDHVEALRPDVDEGVRGRHLTEVCKGTSSFVSRGVTDLVGFAVALACVAVVGAYMLSGVPPGSGPFLAVAGLVALFTLVTLGLVIGIALRIRRRRRMTTSPLRLEPVEAMLGDSGAFDRVLRPSTTKVMDLPVIVRGAFGPEAGTAPVARGTVRSTSSSHGMAAHVSIVETRWPAGTIDCCRVVPDEWISIELEASKDLLDRLPPGPREERSDRRVTWTVRGAVGELDEATAVIRMVATTVRGVEGAPYR